MLDPMAESMAMSRSTADNIMHKALAMRDAALMELADKESPARAFARTGATGLSVLLFSFINGRYQNPKAGGKVGWDFVSAGLGYAGSLFSHWLGAPVAVVEGLHCGADGGLFSFLAKIGAGLGVDSRSTAPAAPADKQSGYHGRYDKMAGVGALTADEASIYASPRK